MVRVWLADADNVVEEFSPSATVLCEATWRWRHFADAPYGISTLEQYAKIFSMTYIVAGQVALCEALAIALALSTLLTLRANRHYFSKVVSCSENKGVAEDFPNQGGHFFGRPRVLPSDLRNDTGLSKNWLPAAKFRAQPLSQSNVMSMRGGNECDLLETDARVSQFRKCRTAR